MSGVKKFIYHKPNGEISNRVLWVLGKPSDCFYGIDLSQFEPQEQEYYLEELERISEMFKEEISELGLDSCYRQFKQNRIQSPQ